jgi:flagellar FliJ protein
MKKYTFSLAKVLRVRRIQEEQAAAQLAAARAAATAAAAKEAGAAHALASRCARGGLQPAVSFLAWAETAMLAGEALSDARSDVQAADEEMEDRRQEWSSAAARVSALEHLDERGREVHALERRRDETKTTDDIVTGRSGSRRTGQGDTPSPPGRWERP